MTALTVNGRPLSFAMDPQTPLLWALRDAANLTGTKYGCGSGECGACIVWVDGKAQPSCQITLAQVEGGIVTTIEGLSRDRSHPLQQALVAQGAIQCGFCTSGLVMAGAALLASNPSPSVEQIRHGLSNICRCGVTPRLVRAMLQAAEKLRAASTTGLAQP